MDIRGIGYIGFETPHVDAWRDYGPNILGMGIGENPEGDKDSLYLRMDDRRHRIALHPGKIDRVAYMGWEAVGRLAYLAAIEKLKADGFAVEIGDVDLCEIRGVREVARFKDPIGFQHEIFYGQKFHPLSFVPGRAHTGFAMDERGFGHVVLMSPKFDQEVEDFFLKTMGMKWYGWGAGKGKTGFFRAKLNDKTSHDIGIGHAPGRMGIQHIGIFVNNIRDVGETYDLVKKEKLQMLMTLGQHSQDPHLSFYHFSPSGFAVETIAEHEPWPGDAFELNPQKLSIWGHELVGPILGPSVKTPEELLGLDD
ncbi:MAG: 2,3-dihydroxybiphenyl 1,2-dioxygenase [Robiginitomaculum sp.]|nr:MAG: 2,3-dihydroxybiphenyl 1,2-dioxygenase [Robiginitomaculum sp.]